MDVATELVPFDDAHAGAVLGWARSDEELLAWASLTVDRALPAIFAEWHADPAVRPFLLLAGGVPIAYGEIWEDRERDEVELARLIVAPQRRGRGIGRTLVRMLTDRASRAGFDEIWVRVVPTNAPALACYRSAGFTRASPDEEADFNRGQPRPYVWMRVRPGPAGACDG